MNEAAAHKIPKSLVVGVVFFGIILALCVFEVGLRLIGFRYHLYPEKIQFGYPRPEHFATLYRADKERLWVRQDYFKSLEAISAEKPQIILMGDSCTEFGSYDQDLRQLISRDYPGKNIALEKVGHGGWSTYQGLRQLELDVAPIKPKIATFYFGWNDHWKGFGIEDKEVAGMNSSLYVYFEPLRIAQLSAKAYIAATKGVKPGNRRVQLDDFRSNIKNMIAVSRANDILPVMVTAPASHEKGKEPKYLKGGWLDNLGELVDLHIAYVNALRETASAEGAPLCDLFAEFDKIPFAERRERYFKVDGIHLTKEGYSLLGQKLYDCLRRDAGAVLDSLPTQP